MNRLVLDIEANGLNEINLNTKGNVIPEVTQVHCLVIKDVDTNEIQLILVIVLDTVLMFSAVPIILLATILRYMTYLCSKGSTGLFALSNRILSLSPA